MCLLTFLFLKLLISLVHVVSVGDVSFVQHVSELHQLPVGLAVRLGDVTLELSCFGCQQLF